MAADRKLAREKATEQLLDVIQPKVTFTDNPPIPQSIYCLLCNRVLRRPLQMSCGHRCCKSCFDTMKSNNSGEKFCPDDKEKIERTFPDINALTEIMFFMCFCVSKDEGCVWIGKLLELEDHLRICEFNANQLCPWNEVHCQFTGSKKEIEKHLKEYNTRHNTLFVTFLSEVMESFNISRVSMNELKHMTKELEKRLGTASDALLATQATLAATVEFLQRHNLTKDNLREWFQNVDTRLVAIEQNELPGLKNLQSVKELIEKVEKQQSDINEVISGSDSSEQGTIMTKKRFVQDKVSHLDKTSKQHHTQLQDTDLKIRLFQSATFDGNYTWKLDNLRNRFQEALTGKIAELYTPPLYTSPFGYKFSAKVLLYGDPKEREVGSSTYYMSLYFVIMQGDFDEILPFPFPYPVTITLLNLSKKNDITHSLIPDNKIHFQKPFKDMNPAVGFSKFCSHDSLYSEGFVKDDAIYFKIMVDKSGHPSDHPRL